MRARLAAMMLMLLAAGSVAAAPPKPFLPGSYDVLVAAWQDRPFLLVLWSITCAPCREEFATLSAVRREHPELPLVLISTDDIAEADMAATILKKYSLDDVEAWMFADDNAQRLRYEIDPAWYGEMPRAYFYAADRRREAVSGRLPRERIESWLSEIRESGDSLLI